MMFWIFTVMVLGELIVIFSQGERIRQTERARDNLGTTVEELMGRLKRERMLRDLNYRELSGQLETMTRERDRLLAGAIHDVELEMVFKDEADAEDYIASRKRAVEAFEKVTEEMDMSGPEWDDDHDQGVEDFQTIEGVQSVVRNDDGTITMECSPDTVFEKIVEDETLADGSPIPWFKHSGENDGDTENKL